MSSIVQPDVSTARRVFAIPPPPHLSTWQIVTLTALTLWMYWSTLSRLSAQWLNDENFQHGWIVPIFCAYVIWQERRRLAQIPIRPSWLGLGVIVAACCELIVGRLGVELYLQRTSLVFLLAGAVILFEGWRFFDALIFPWACLFLAIPIPAILFNRITFPLQILASKVAAAILPIFHVPLLRQGNVIILASQQLEVADACSGIRSLMSLVTLAIIYGYLLQKRKWVRYVLALASFPIAVAANGFRVVSTGLMVEYWTPNAADGRFHKAWGWLVFVISLLMVYGLDVLIDRSLPEPDRSTL